MSNDIAVFKQAGLPANIGALKDALGTFNRGLKTDSTQYLKIGQQGVPEEGLIVYGVDKDEIEEGAELAVDVANLQHGHILVDGTRVIEENFVSFLTPLPTPDETKAGGKKEWCRAVCGDLIIVSGEDRGTLLTYNGRSRGHFSFFAVITQALSAQLDAIEKRRGAKKKEDIYPIITLEATSYENKTYSKTIYSIVPTVERWVDKEGLQKLLVVKQ